MKIASKSNLHIVTTPTFAWLAEYAKSCNSRMLIGSPYVNDGIICLTNLVPKSVSRTLVTRTDLRDFAVGASNLDTLCTLAQDGVEICSLSNLHAKIYIFDNTSALITSANATFSGLYHNLECGIGTNDKFVVEQLSQSLLKKGLGADRSPRAMNLGELKSLYAPLKCIKASLPKPPREISPNGNATTVEAVFSISDRNALLEGFTGWQNLTLRGVLAMSEYEFGVQKLLDVCAPLAAKEYPNNHNVHHKLRQQLQMLRDKGLIEFLSRGRYKRTMH